MMMVSANYYNSLIYQTFLQCHDTVGWVTGRASALLKKLDVVLLVVIIDWSFARLIAPVVTTTSIILGSNKPS